MIELKYLKINILENNEVLVSIDTKSKYRKKEYLCSWKETLVNYANDKNKIIPTKFVKLSLAQEFFEELFNEFYNDVDYIRNLYASI